MAGPDIKGTRAEAVRVGRPSDSGASKSGKPPITGTRVASAPTGGGVDSGKSTRTSATLDHSDVRVQAPSTGTPGGKRGK